MEKIVLYSRVSTVDQDFESQFVDLRSWAKLNNYEVVEIFGEKKSGYDLTVERIEFERMRQYVIDNKIKLIACWELSRFGRNTLQTLNEIQFFAKLDINIYFKKENIHSMSNEPTSKLVLTLLSSMAELERNSIVERSKRGRMAAALKGKAINYGIMPYGYTKDKDGNLIINDFEAVVVREIFSLAVKGNSMLNICNILNSKGIKTRYTLMGKKRKTYNNGDKEILWGIPVIRKMLHNPLYKGDRSFVKEYVKAPAIIPEDEWNYVQERFAENVGYINRTKYDYVFKGKLRCSKCGRIFVSYFDKRRDAGHYFCSGKNDLVIKCDIGQINQRVIDDLLYKQLFSNISINEALTKAYFKNNEGADYKKEIMYYEEQIVDLNKKKQRLINLYKEDFIDDKTFKSEQLTIKNKITENENNIRFINAKSTASDKWKNKIGWVSYMNDARVTNDFAIKRNVVNDLIEKILIYNVQHIEHNKLGISLMKNDKVIFAEVYTSVNIPPIKMLILNRTKTVLCENNILKLNFDKATGILTE